MSSAQQTRTETTELDDCWNRIGVWSPDGASCPRLEEAVHCRNCELFSAAARRLLERELPLGYQQEWTGVYGQARRRQPVARSATLLFRLGDDWLGLDSDLVQEITDMRTIQRLPHYGDGGVIKGLVNIRGELRVCVSLGNLLGLDQGLITSDDLGYDVFARMVLIARDADEFVFPVTEVVGIRRYEADALQPVPATIAKAKATYTRHVLPHQEQHVALLDHELLLYTLRKSLK